MTPIFSPRQSCETVIIAGFGGQGIILTGRLLAQIAMKADKEVTFMPAYGAEVRGGTSNCTVIYSDNSIASPVVSSPQSLLVLNKASLAKFGPRLSEHGLLVYNSSRIDTEPQGLDRATVVAVPADELAVELGNQRVANMVMLGAHLQARDQLAPKQAAAALPDVLAQRYHDTMALNAAALERGAAFSVCPTPSHAR